MFYCKKCFENKNEQHIDKRYLYWDWFDYTLSWEERGRHCELCGQEFWDDQPIILTGDDMVNKYHYRNLNFKRD